MKLIEWALETGYYSVLACVGILIAFIAQLPYHADELPGSGYRTAIFVSFGLLILGIGVLVEIRNFRAVRGLGGEAV